MSVVLLRSSAPDVVKRAGGRVSVLGVMFRSPREAESAVRYVLRESHGSIQRMRLLAILVRLGAL